MNQGQILLVEDRSSDEALTIRALKKSNILNDIVVAHDGAEALELLLGEGSEQSAPPSLVLLDLKLPKVGGLEVLRRIRANDRTRLVPVVILTSSKEQEDVLEGYRGGANAYVRKPVKFAEFADAVKTVGLFWLLLNELPPDISSLPTVREEPPTLVG